MDMLTNDLLSYFQGYFFPFLRLTGLFLTAPFFNSHSIPHKIRLLFSLIIAFPVSAQLSHFPPIDIFTIKGVLTIAEQLVIGAAIGFVFELVMQVFVVAGQIVSMQSGLSFSSMVDPQSGVSVPIISQFYLFFATIIFLTLNGHLQLIQIIATSFQTIPISPEKQWIAACSMEIVHWSSTIFYSGLLIALPLGITLLLINLALAVISRVAPQLNVFSLGFPVTLSVGIGLIWLTFSQLGVHVEMVTKEGFNLVNRLLVG